MLLRWGICCTGKISHDFSAAVSLLSKAKHQLEAVAARNGERAKDFAKTFAIPKFYGSYEDLAKDSNVNIVYIGSINTEHHRLSLLMLNHGKHVVCEKPLALNLHQAQEMMQLARQKKLFFMEAAWSQFFPVYEQIRKELAAGSIGDVRVVQASFGLPVLVHERTAKNELGGGGLLDIGIYLIHFANLVFKEKPEKIVAEGFLTETGVDESSSIILKYSGGRMAHLMYHVGMDLSNFGLVFGTKGHLEKSLGTGFRFKNDVYQIHDELEFSKGHSPMFKLTICRAADQPSIEHHKTYVRPEISDFGRERDNKKLYLKGYQNSSRGFQLFDQPCVHSPFWCPTRITTPEKEYVFPLPESSMTFNYINSAGLSYEAEYVHSCIEQGHLECPLVPHSNTELTFSIMDEIRRQIGLKYAADEI